MRFGAGFWIQRTSWPALRDACVEAERAGFDTIWLDDHLLADEGEWHDGKLEGWTTLSAVAAVTSRARLGLLVAANTFRNPGLTAKLATTLDHVSDGRAILGVGGGWFEREHDAFGLDFGSGFGERLDRLDESVMLIRRLLDGERVTHEGRFYRFHDALCEPRPIQAHLPILVGGSGPKKTLRTTARYADMWNGYGDPARIAATSDILRERCAEEGRAFDTIERTVTMEAVVRDDRETASRAFADVLAAQGLTETSAARAEGHEAFGPPAVVADRVAAFEAVGVAEVIWVFRDPFDVETMGRLADVKNALPEARPALRAP